MLWIRKVWYDFVEVIVAETAGFCHGVSRAVSMCEKAAAAHKNCVTLGPIIHNEHVIRGLEAKGIRTAADIFDISPEDTVIIRSHGAGKQEMETLASLGSTVIDATCPDVMKIHDIVREESRAGQTMIIIGQRHHPEITAISSWCRTYKIFENTDELSEWLTSKENAAIPISVVCQTTISKNLYHTCTEIIKKECTNSKIFDTICKATSKRQQEAVELAKIADALVVVGSKNSANSLNLAEICNEFCSKVFFVQSAEDIRSIKIQSTDVVGVTAGASTPARIIKEVTQKMREEVSMEETVVENGENPQAPQISVPEPDESVQEEVLTEEAVLPQETSTETDTAEEIPEAVPDMIPDKEPEEVSVEVPAEPAQPVAEDQIQDSEAETEIPVSSEDDDDQSAATESFEEMLEKSIKTLRTGEKVTGVVTSITSTEVSVDLGTKQSGYIPITEFTDDENTDIDEIIKIGDTIESFVMRVNDVEGMVMLSKRRLDAAKNWDIVESAKESRAIVEGVVSEENKGGVVVNVKGVRVFVPASQTGLPKSSPMTELVKKTVKLRITEVNQSRRRVVGSIRMVQNDERREKSDKIWTDIEVGKKYDGVVKSMTTYGVFVDIGGVDGMIHISELSWTRIKQPSEVMAVGDEVSVYVLSFDKESRKISLGYKKNEDNPWTRFTSTYAVGDVVNVKVVKMMPFGAFAEICTGVDGLIHISQITDHRIGLPSEVLSDGQMVDVKITEIDNDRKKVSLSIRALIEPASQPVTDDDIAEAADDNTPVIVYDTDAPPPLEDEEDEEEEE